MLSRAACRRTGPGPSLLAPLPAPLTAWAELLRTALLMAQLSAVCLGLALLMLLALGPRPAQAQLNFRPVEAGDVVETEEKLTLVKGLEVSGAYALTLQENLDKALVGLDTGTRMDQDLRLKFNTTMNREVSVVLTVQPGTAQLGNANLRAAPPNQNGGVTDSNALALTAREAYLRYFFNPNSTINLGKFEISLGDKRGKVLDAVVPSISFNCRVGTWCMPFGALKLSAGSADWLYHWALQYRAWDDTSQPLRRALEVEIFRIIYTERNIPLAKNLGPGFYDPSNLPSSSTNCLTAPTAAGCRSVSKDVLDDNGSPVFYDATSQNYFGLRANWEASAFFMTLDVTSNQGNRDYHLYNDPATGFRGTLLGPFSVVSKDISGLAWETEFGIRWLPEDRGRVGLRFMTASGDPTLNQVVISNGVATYTGAANGATFLRGQSGYHEITPGTYRGTRLYFNGANSALNQFTGQDTAAGLGGGLGHSVNNTQVMGVFLDYSDPGQGRMGYSAGMYALELNNPILNDQGQLKSTVGVEWDNMITFWLTRQLRLELEGNLFLAQGAFSLNDYTPPPSDQELYIQVLARMVYRF